MQKLIFTFGFFALFLATLWIGYQYYIWTPLPDYEFLPSSRTVSSDKYEKSIRDASEYLQRLPETLSVPSVSVSAGINGDVIWSESVGYANVENRVPANPETLYRIGGSAKSITATALMKLADQGRIDLDAPVNGMLPQIPESAPYFTTRELLTHTAGFGYHNDFGIKARLNALCECLQFNSVDNAMDLVKDHSLKYTPGERYVYSTYGYIALSKIIEEVSGQPFHDFLSASVFLPAAIESVFPDQHPNNPPGLTQAVDYKVDGDSFTKWRTLELFPHRRNLSYNWAGGGMIATPTALVKLGNALLTNHGFVAPDIRREFMSPQQTRNGEPISDHTIALGWTLIPPFSLELAEGETIEVSVARSGGLKNGSGNIFLLFPDYNLVMDVAINATIENRSFDTFFREIIPLTKPFLRVLHNPSAGTK